MKWSPPTSRFLLRELGIDTVGLLGFLVVRSVLINPKRGIPKSWPQFPDYYCLNPKSNPKSRVQPQPNPQTSIILKYTMIYKNMEKNKKHNRASKLDRLQQILDAGWRCPPCVLQLNRVGRTRPMTSKACSCRARSFLTACREEIAFSLPPAVRKPELGLPCRLAALTD